MRVSYEATRYVNGQYTVSEFGTVAEGITAIETVGAGTLIRLVYSPNLHGGEDGKSVRAWQLENGVWYALDLFIGGRLGLENPH